MPGTGGVALSVGPSTALDVAALLKALDRYPFGCTEQIASRALPLLYVNELAGEAQLALDTAVDQRIRDAIERMLARQGSNGSFGLWGRAATTPGSTPTSPTSSPARASATSRCRTSRSSWRSTACAITSAQSDPAKDGGRELAYAYYVLARNGVAPLGDLRYIADTKLDDLEDPDRQGAARRGARHARRPRARRAGLRRGAARRSRRSRQLELGRTDYGSSCAMPPPS